MQHLKKLLAIVSIGQISYGRWLLPHLLPCMFLIAGLTIITSMLISAVIISMVYILYMTLLQSGYETKTVVLITAILGVVIITIFTTLLCVTVRYLQRMLRSPLKQASLPTSVKHIVSSFLNGFNQT